MSSHLFLEVNGYFVHCSTVQNADQTWMASVLFERKADHQYNRVPGMRHNLTTPFDNDKQAMQAAISYGTTEAEQRDPFE
jgi:hypothetical protein